MIKRRIYGILFFVLLIAASSATSEAATFKVSSTNPANAANNVALNSSVTVTFNENLKCSTVSIFTFTLVDINNNPVSGAIASCSGESFTFTPSSNLTDCMVFTGTVYGGAAGVLDTSGDTLASNKVWSFTTVKQAPTVTSTNPANGATGVLKTATLTAIFSESITASTINSSTFTLKCGGTAVAGSAFLDTTDDPTGKTAVFIPSSNLPANTSCTATLTTGVENTDSASICGGPTHMAANYSWTFTVINYIAPVVVSVTPANGSTGNAVTTTATATFSEAVAPSTINTTNVYLTDSLGNLVAASVSLNAAETVVTLTPLSSLNYNATYTVTITTGVTNLSGTPMVSNYSWSFSTQAAPMAQYCQIPPFVSVPVPPNVLIILSNSQSFDEDFYGNAVGSYAPNSMSVIGRQVLDSLVNTFINGMNIGLMTYNLPSGVSNTTLSGSDYFTSYDPRSYCPFPPPQCQTWCQTGTNSSRTTCRNTCQVQNPLFDETYMETVITNRPIGNATRNKYCTLTYPKTQQAQNPTSPTNSIYYAMGMASYGFLSDGWQFFYSTNYDWSNEDCSTTNATDYGFNTYGTKVGSSDGSPLGADPGEYSNLLATYPAVVPTDSDLAEGFYNYGQRIYFTYIGPTWFANSSPGGGYLKIPCAANNSSNTQLNALNTALTAFPNNPTGYMSCTAGNMNTCSYVVNTGLTPTGGTLVSALDYFTGAKDYQTGVQYTSPIQYSCQRNFIIYVTNGLPSVDQNGNTVTSCTEPPSGAATFMPAVLSNLTALRNISYTLSGTTYQYDVETFVVGLGLETTAVTDLNSMAVQGGTAVNGAAYYASNQAQLENSLTQIFQTILNKVSSGTASSVLASGQGSGANIVQAVFYPKRTLGATVEWTSRLTNLWYYLDPYFTWSSIYSDDSGNYTEQGGEGGDKILNLTNDSAVTYIYDAATQATEADLQYNTTGNGIPNSAVMTVPIEDIVDLWEAGMQLFTRTSARTIFTTTDGQNLINFSNSSSSTAATLQPYMQVPNANQAAQIIQYVNGTDQMCSVTTTTSCTTNSNCPSGETCITTYRPRTVTINSQTGVWKLGDIIQSTPKAASTFPLNTYYAKYNDATYNAYTTSSNYLNRGMIFAGGNDGMLHAFKLGTVLQSWSGQGQYEEAEIINPDTGAVCSSSDSNQCGMELWSFIPMNMLPYLKYMADPTYCHLYYVDLPTFVFDASIGGAATAVRSPDGSSWKTILIGGMRLGGACANSTATCTNCVKTPGIIVGGTQIGFSSYFALDITDTLNYPDDPVNHPPVLLWEFSNPSLGFTSSGPAVVRIDPTQNGDGTPNTTTNGNWYVVFGSGPTGPINQSTNQFMGYSDQDLQLFVLDLKSGNLQRQIDTGIQYAFAGSMFNSTVNVNLATYEDDAVYIGYTQAENNPPTGSTTWNIGGVGRLLTLGQTPPFWEWGTVINGIGAVTSSIASLVDNGSISGTSALWLYFGTGRYFFKTSTTVDDQNTQQAVYGIKDPCFSNPFAQDTSTSQPFMSSCPSLGSLTNVTGDTSTTNRNPNSITSGWFINLASSTSGPPALGAERVITDTSANTTGTVFFTSFEPYTNDPCQPGGQSFIWATNYNTGDSVANTLQGTALLQVSTGSIQQINLSTTFLQAGSSYGANPNNTNSMGNRRSAGMEGVPPTSQGLSIVGQPPAVQRVIHIKER